MTLYLEMWDKVRQLETKQIQEFVAQYHPATGNRVDFLGLQVIDIDLLEALTYYLDQKEQTRDYVRIQMKTIQDMFDNISDHTMLAMWHANRDAIQSVTKED